MHADMTDFVCDEARPSCRIAVVDATDDAALAIVERTRSFQCGITRCEPRQFQIETLDCGQNQFHWRIRIGTRSNKLRMQGRSGNANWLERFHVIFKDSANSFAARPSGQS